MIDSLIQFVGIGKLKNAVAGWRKSCHSAKKITRGFHREQAFPWWRALDEYWEIAKHGKGLYGLNAYIVKLARDAHVVQTVAATMPAAVRMGVAAKLGSRENAPPALFEISIAHQFLKLGYNLAWCEDNGAPMPEFVATRNGLEFEVECKQISFDTGRHISRVDFCQVADLIEPKLRRHQVMGRVEITLNERLSSKPQDREQIAHDVLKVAYSSTQGEIAYPWGSVIMQLQPYDDFPLDFQAFEQAERKQKSSDAQIVITADAGKENRAAINPLLISMKCSNSDEVLEAAFSTLAASATRQLSGNRPGVLCLFLPDIDDFESLRAHPALVKMVDELFESASRLHVAAIVLASNDRVRPLAIGGFDLDRPILSYRNTKCRFPEAAEFRFLAE